MRKLAFVTLILVASKSAIADNVWGIVPSDVMAGASSAFNDGVWLRVAGQPGHANCYYAPLNVSLFYVKSDSGMNPNKVLAIFLTAKATNKTVSFEYTNNSTSADFYGYGISSCEIRRVAVSS